MKIYLKDGKIERAEYTYHTILQKTLLEAFVEIEKISKDKVEN